MSLRCFSSARLTMTLLAIVLSAPAAHALPAGSLRTASLAAELPIGVAVGTNWTAAELALGGSEFTSATAENSMKWKPLQPSRGVWDFADADAFVSWASAQGHRIRGHTLFWSRSNGLPTWLEAEVNGAADPQATLTQLMQDHAATAIGRYTGQIAQWDVVNEPLDPTQPVHDPASFFYQTLGEAYLDVAFNAAHAADPNALLFLNETVVADFPAKVQGLISIVSGMQSRGVPIHGVGLQGHFFFNPPNITQLRSDIEALAALGIVVEFTEVDIRLPLFSSAPDPLAAQAAAYEALTGLCLELAACTGITVWGLDDGHTWLDTFFLTAGDAPNQPLLFDAAYAQKPAYEGVVSGLLASPPEVPSLSPPAVLLLVPLMVWGAAARGRNGRRA